MFESAPPAMIEIPIRVHSFNFAKIHTASNARKAAAERINANAGMSLKIPKAAPVLYVNFVNSLKINSAVYSIKTHIVIMMAVISIYLSSIPTQKVFMPSATPSSSQVPVT